MPEQGAAGRVGRLYAGTSGFAYPSWKPAFYPANLPQKEFLTHYASQLNAVEINYTFRRLPSAATLEGWVNNTPEGFQFAIKGHQRITHIDRLRPSEFSQLFFRAIDPLRVRGRLGPVLLQLPPALKLDVALLDEFLGGVPDDIRLAFEFRHASWFTGDVYRRLEDKGAALCLAESEKLETPPVLTAPFVYFRLRKPDYSLAERQEVGARVRQLLAQGKDVFVFFKHEDTPAGALYARELLGA